MARIAKVAVSADINGPLGDGTAHDAVVAWLDDTKRTIAQEGVNNLHSFVMDRTGRATGHYQSEIQTSTLLFNDIKIHDPIVYGPWLQGSSKRNRSTRFKGYRLWSKTRQLLQERAPEIAREKFREYASRIGASPL